MSAPIGQEWRTRERRQLAIHKIAEAVRMYPGVLAHTPADVEMSIFLQARTEHDYMNSVSKTILFIKQTWMMQQQQAQAQVQQQQAQQQHGGWLPPHAGMGMHPGSIGPQPNSGNPLFRPQGNQANQPMPPYGTSSPRMSSPRPHFMYANRPPMTSQGMGSFMPTPYLNTFSYPISSQTQPFSKEAIAAAVRAAVTARSQLLPEQSNSPKPQQGTMSAPIGEEWRTPEKRQLVVRKIAETMRMYPDVLARTPADVEMSIFQRARTEHDYMNMVGKIVLSIRQKGMMQQQQAQAQVQQQQAQQQHGGWLPPHAEIKKLLQEGSVELTITRINMHGPPGAGKTCAQRLLLNQPPPDKLITNSTPIARSAVVATRVTCNTSNDDDNNVKWKAVNSQELLEKLASYLKAAILPSENKLKSLATPEEPVSTSQSTESDEHPRDVSESNEKIIEVVSKLIPETNAQLSDHWVYIIDSGGQPAFQELLPLFVRTASVNIITIDLSKDLDELLEFQYRINGKHFPCGLNMRYSNKTFLETTIRSRAVYQRLNVPYLINMPDHPMYLCLGTHSDKITKETLLEMNKTLVLELSHFDDYLIREKRNQLTGDSIIFPVNTLLPEGSEEREEVGKKLCTLISKRDGTSFKIKMPIRWFAFELQLQEICNKEKAESEQRSFLTKDEVLSAGKILQMTEDDTLNAIKYLHDATIILYFEDVLPNLVFVDPQPILEVLSRLLSITYVEADLAVLISNSVPSEDVLGNLHNFGLFKQNLLDNFKSEKGVDLFSTDFQSSDFIKLLKHLHIIAEVHGHPKGDYFLPCALRSYCDDNKTFTPPKTEAKPLLIVWQNPVAGASLPVPQGVFPLTIVQLLNQKKYKVDFPQSLSSQYYRYRDAMSLRIIINKKQSTIHIINRYTCIEIYFSGRKEICPQVRELVTAAIKSSSDSVNITHDFVYAFACPQDYDCYSVVNEDQDGVNCSLCPESVEIRDNSYWCWFEGTSVRQDVDSTGKAARSAVTTNRSALTDILSSCESFPNVDQDQRVFDSATERDFRVSHLNDSSSSMTTGSHSIIRKRQLDLSSQSDFRGQSKFPRLSTKEQYQSTDTAVYCVPHSDVYHTTSTEAGAVGYSRYHEDQDMYTDQSSQRHISSRPSETQLSITQLEEVMQALRQSHFDTTKWRSVGLSLGLYDNTLSAIKDDSNDVEECLRKTLRAWLDRRDHVNKKGGATWLSLINALFDNDLIAVAESI